MTNFVLEFENGSSPRKTKEGHRWRVQLIRHLVSKRLNYTVVKERILMHHRRCSVNIQAIWYRSR